MFRSRVSLLTRSGSKYVNIQQDGLYTNNMAVWITDIQEGGILPPILLLTLLGGIVSTSYLHEIFDLLVFRISGL
jgi:hypothetical protein